ncbi:hypothetical protein PagCFBP13532_22490 [Pantoea agglomerans]|nr:hypothetical protein PagCFBP13505_20355 [Pantoea agglomerans]TKK14562.1 hypothetical protein PagCFBP13516_21670 [Pantoea agglomerans]TKK26136.1 hypothetical protein PagCFBP13532_22490 [Pantoea agglomerans]
MPEKANLTEQGNITSMKRLQLIRRRVIGSQKKLMICSIKMRRQKNSLMNKRKTVNDGPDFKGEVLI